MKRIDVEIFAEYFQFYLMDAEVRPPIPEDWTEDDVATRAKVAPNLIVVCPIRNMTVPVTVMVLGHQPEEGVEDWDHIVECGLELPSGRLLIDECTGEPVATLELEPGCYAVRIYYGGLGTLDESGLEGDDQYKVVLWPSRPRPLRVLKRWSAA